MKDEVSDELLGFLGFFALVAVVTVSGLIHSAAVAPVELAAYKACVARHSAYACQSVAP